MAKKVCISLLAILTIVTLVLLWNLIITTKEMQNAEMEGLKGLGQAYYGMASYYLDGENDEQRILILNKTLHNQVLMMLPIRETNVFRGGQDSLINALRQQSEALYDLVYIEGSGGTPDLNIAFKQEMAEGLLLLSANINQYVSDRTQQSREAIISRAEANIEIHRRWMQEKRGSLPRTRYPESADGAMN